jgi:hypothetical protein
MDGTFYRAAGQPEGDLTFGEKGLAGEFRKDERRAVKRLVIARPIVAEQARCKELIAGYVILRDGRKSMCGIGIERARRKARRAHAADQLQGHEECYATAE